MSGRAADNRLVHFTPAGTDPRPGDVVTTVITRGAPNYLLADASPASVRRTRGGDAWEARHTDQGDPGADPEAAKAGGDSVLLGMPSRRPAFS